MSSIIVFVIIYIVVTVMKTTMKRAAETFEANMPGKMPIPMPEAEEPVTEHNNMDEVTDTTPDIGALLQALSAKAAVETEPSVEMPASKHAKADKPTPQATVPDTGEINLRTADEARRAFIYSEIFNRKYE